MMVTLINGDGNFRKIIYPMEKFMLAALLICVSLTCLYGLLRSCLNLQEMEKERIKREKIARYLDEEVAELEEDFTRPDNQARPREQGRNPNIYGDNQKFYDFSEGKGNKQMAED